MTISWKADLRALTETYSSMEKVLIKFVRERGGDVHYLPNRELTGWSDYRLVGLYLSNDVLRVVSTHELWDITSHLDQRWCDVCEEYQKAVFDAVDTRMIIDHNLF